MSDILNSILNPILTGLVVGCVMMFVLSKFIAVPSEENSDEHFYNVYYPSGDSRAMDEQYSEKYYFMVTFIVKGRMKKPFHCYHKLSDFLTLDEAMKYIEMHYSSMLSATEEAWDYKIVSKKTRITAEQAKELDELMAELEKREQEAEEEERKKKNKSKRKRSNSNKKKAPSSLPPVSINPTDIINKEEETKDE